MNAPVPKNQNSLTMEAVLLRRFQQTSLAWAAVPQPLQDKMLGPAPMSELALDAADLVDATSAVIRWAESENDPAGEIIYRGCVGRALASYRISGWAINRALELYRPWYLSLKPLLVPLAKIVALRRMIAERNSKRAAT